MAFLPVSLMEDLQKTLARGKRYLSTARCGSELFTRVLPHTGAKVLFNFVASLKFLDSQVSGLGNQSTPNRTPTIHQLPQNAADTPNTTVEKKRVYPHT